MATTAVALLVPVALVACGGDDSAATEEACLLELGVLAGAELVRFVDYDQARASGFLVPESDLPAVDPTEQRATADHYLRLRTEVGLQFTSTFARSFERFMPTGFGVVDVRCAVSSRDDEAIRLVDEDPITLDESVTAEQDGDLLIVASGGSSVPELVRLDAADPLLADTMRALVRERAFQGAAVLHGRQAVGWGVSRVDGRLEYLTVRLIEGADDDQLQIAAERAVEAQTDAAVVDVAAAVIEVEDGAATTRLPIVSTVDATDSIAGRSQPLVAPSDVLDPPAPGTDG